MHRYDTRLTGSGRVADRIWPQCRCLAYDCRICPFADAVSICLLPGGRGGNG